MISLVEYPKRRWKLVMALVFSIAVHFGLYILCQTVPLITIAMGLRGIEFVEEAYDPRILINFSQRLQYPAGYIGFRTPGKILSLEEMKKEESRRARLEARRRQREKERAEAEEREREREEAEARARAEDLAKADPTPTPTPDQKDDRYPGGFGKINTAPIKDQIQRLYDAHRAGKIAIPTGKLKVGVSGSIMPDGTLANYRVTIPSGVKEIDDAAMAILEAVSISRALGPLHSLTSLSMELSLDTEAQLNVVGFASSEQEAKSLVDLANTMLIYARIKKLGDPAAMVMLNNLKVSRTGQRIQAVISVSRQTATETLNKSMEKGQT